MTKEITFGLKPTASKLGKDEVLNTHPHLYSLYTDIKGKPLKQGDTVVYARENSLFFGIVLLEDIEHEGLQLEAVPHVKDMRGFLVNNGRNFLTA